MPADSDVKKQIDDLLKADDFMAVIYGLAAGLILVIRLKDVAMVNRLIPGNHPEIYKNLDVSIVDHIILEKLLGMAGGADKSGLAYSHDLLDSVSRVKSGEFQLTILIRAVKPETLKAVSDAGDKMPPKSTYFYPKAPAGLILNRLV